MRLLTGSLLFKPLETDRTGKLQFDPNSIEATLGSILTLLFLLTIYVGILYFRERRRARAWPRLTDRELTSVSRTEATVTLSAAEWQERALNAEARAAQQASLIREQLMPELREFVQHSVVQGLAAQRDTLLSMQQQALQSVLELESRLAELHAPLQERIRAYENRIRELETELGAQNAEVRELTRTMLDMMRQRLGAERKRSELPALESYN